ncbi:MAG: PD-(D/E)XK nuclease family protein [Pseudomonadales bacterium]
MNESSDTVFISDLGELFALEHTLILTPNQRLAQQILQQGDDVAQLSGEKSWSMPPVMAVSSWLQMLWENATAAGLKPCNEYWVLSAAEELELWRGAMLASLDTAFIAPESAAKQLMQAWQVLCNWQVDIQSKEQRSRFQLNDNCSFFIKVCDRVLLDCQRIGAVCSAQIPGLLAELESPLSGRVLLYGFEELLPIHEHLLTQWRVAKTSVQIKTSHHKVDQPLEVVRASTFEAEVLAAAEWAYRIFSQDETARIAVIVPQLDVRRAQIERSFESVFTPNASHPEVNRQVTPFNISAGVSLAGTPIVQSALTLLNALQGSVSSTELPYLLYSPFYAHSYGTDRAELYKLEHRLRSYGDSELSLGAVVSEAEHLFALQSSANLADNNCIGLLLSSLTDCRRISHNREAMAFDDHLGVFKQQLSAFGWPGNRSADSVEYQQLVSFANAISSCHALANLRFADRKKITGKQSLALIEQVLHAQVFQAQTSDSRVQVLGLLEGAGLPFTHARLCDFSIGQWPANASPSAYIPYALQRELRMPHCDALREADFSQRLFQRYQQQVQTFSCSYAVVDGSTDVLPSSLLNKLAINEVDIAVQENGEEPGPIEPVPDSVAIGGHVDSVSLTTLEKIRATTALLTDQAACPFKAFIRHRLQVRALESTQLGLDGRERGIILHDAMEAFWREAKGQSTLTEATEDRLRESIDDAVAAAIVSAKRRLAGRESLAYLGIEAIRVSSIMFQWLQNEAQRSPFTVMDLECAFDSEIVGRPAQLRIDRVDLLEDGSLLLIEYKSGAVSEKDTMQEPLLAPQLALYLLRYRSASGQQASGGAVCKMDDQVSTWMGAGSAKYLEMPLQRRLLKHEQDEQSRDDLWLEQTQLWQREIGRLENSFIAGEAGIEPAKGSQTCRQCDYASICRYAIDGAGA